MPRALFYILLFFTNTFVFGQVTLTPYYRDEPVKIGSLIQIIVVAKSDNPFDIQAPNIDSKDIEVVSLTSHLLDTGDNGIALEIDYVIQAKRSGNLKIGSFRARQNGKYYKSDPIKLTITKEKIAAQQQYVPDKARVVLVSTIEKREVYTNEANVLELMAFSQNMNSLSNIVNIQVHQPAGVTYDKISDATNEVTQTNGVYGMQIASYIIVSENPGRTVLPAVTAQVVQGGTTTRIVSNRIHYSVMALPDGAPSGFTNGVGSFTATMSIKSHGDVELNKPITVQLKISGRGNMRNLELPQFANLENYDVYKPKITYHLQPTKGGLMGDITAEYIVIPKKTGKIPLSTKDFSFFNTKEHQYKTIKIGQVDIAVSTPEQIANNSSALVKMVNETSTVLSKGLPVPSFSDAISPNGNNKNQRRIPIWQILISLILIIGGTLWYTRRRKFAAARNIALDTGNLVTEPSDFLSENRTVEIQAGLQYLEKLNRNRDYDGFFDAFYDLKSDMEKLIQKRDGMDLTSYVKNKLDAQSSQDFDDIEHKVDMLRFSPFRDSDQMDKLLSQITLVYTEILK